jgi:hypothetical protein
MNRVTSASAMELLKATGPAIASGAVNLISVEAIREHSGERWARKREQVEDFVARAFQRHAGPHDMIVALNDVEFLTVQPDAGRTIALNLSGAVLRETLTYFLGTAARKDFKVFIVTSFQDDKLGVVDADPALFEGDVPHDGAGAESPADLDPFRRSIPLITAAGQAAELELALEPVWNVQAQVVTSILVRHRLSVEDHGRRHAVGAEEGGSNLWGEAAQQILAFSTELLTRKEDGVLIGLHVPVPFEALSSSGWRYRVLGALKGLSAEVRRFMLLEIIDAPDGLPQSRMTELVAALAPFGRAVLARAPSESANMASWRRCGLAGVTLDCGHLDSGDRNARVRLGRFAAAATEAGPACIGYSLASRSLLMAAWSAGFTHLGGAAVEAAAPTPAARRLDPAQFYGPERERSVA